MVEDVRDEYVKRDKRIVRLRMIVNNIISMLRSSIFASLSAAVLFLAMNTLSLSQTLSPTFYPLRPAVIEATPSSRLSYVYILTPLLQPTVLLSLA